MAWGKAGSTTLESAGDDLDITSMTANDFNQFIVHSLTSGNMKHNFRFDDNSGSVYARGRSYNSAGKSNDSSQAQIEYHGDASEDRFEVIYGINLTGEEKLQIHHCITQGASGAGTAPNRSLAVSKAVITDQYTRVDCFNDGGGSFDTGSNITVLGSDVTPVTAVSAIGTNLQYNSLFVEKDTARRYWFTPNTLTFEDDFSGADNWTDDGTSVAVNTSTDVLDWDCIADGNDDLCYKDLTSVSDSKWFADFDITFDTVTSGSSTNGSYLAIYLDSVTTPINTAGHDGLGITYELDDSPNNQASIGAFAIDNKNPYDGMKFNSGTGARSVFTETAQASETQYVRMIRDGDTFTVEIYSDSTRQTLVESESVDATNGGTVSGLRYFKIATGRDNTNNHTFDGTIDNVKFYNNVSSVNKPSNVQDNSILVEKDTGNRYWFSSGTWSAGA